MPTFDKRARYPGGQSRVAIPSLSGGVGRQAPTKRAINEAENLDNVLVTLERSVEKRSPTNFIQRYEDSILSTLDTTVTDSSLNLADQTANADYGFFWFQVSEEQRYLIALNFASASSTDYMQVFKVTKDGFYECTFESVVLAANHAYFTEGNGGTKKFKDSLSSITVGPQMLINNNNVYAGYTSILKTFTDQEELDGVTLDGNPVYGPSTANPAGPTPATWCKIGLDGEFDITGTLPAYDYTADIKGRKLVYFTTTPVDPEGQASIYVDGKFYIRNDQVFVEVPGGTDLEEYLYTKIDKSGTLRFISATDTGGSANVDTFTVDEENMPLELLSFHLIGIEVYDHQHGPTADCTITLTFDELEGRNQFAELTKLYIAGKPLSISDTTLSDNGVDEWYITWDESTAATPTDIEDATSEVYSAHAAASTVPFNVTFSFYGTYQSTADLPTDIQGLVHNYAGGLFTLTNDTVLIFTCSSDGTADGSIPAPATEAGEGDAVFSLRTDNDGGALAKFIPVEDWRYPDSTRRYLGNKLSDFSEFKFPPRAGELTADNDGAPSADAADLNLPPVDMDGLVGETLEELYDDLSAGGTGKIYYVENSYAGEVPGYYIVKDVANSPYTRLIRTPIEYSVLDADRFPKILKIKQFNAGIEEFTIENMNLEERRSGNLQTNPGPEAFKDGIQRQIKSMAFFRDRLFFSAADTVFSSRTGDFSDFWVQNPGIVADTDPIDIRLSTNKYAEVESMTPFSSNLFINTGSDIQFTLKGSENNITPFTAEISPTAFYSTSPLVDPVLLGSQIYFFAPKRAYIFFNDSTVSINQAIEVSLTCPNYLPTNFGDIAVVPGYDTLCMIDNDNKKFVYMYTNRYRGSEVAQNAFFRYIYDSDIVTLNSYDNDIYLVSRHSDYKHYLEYQKFYEEDLSVPRLDHQISISESSGAGGSITYDGVDDETTIVVENYGNPLPDTLYIAVDQPEEERAGEIILLASGQRDEEVVKGVSSASGTLTIVLAGNYTTNSNYRKFIIGTSYTMTIQLSPQFIRDQNQNVIEGVFSMRTLHLQHHNSGSYRTEKKVRGRRSVILEFTPEELDESQVSDPDDLPMPLYEKQGETFSKILGFAAETDVYIVSDYPNPVNIAQIEIKGRFTNKTSGFVR